MEQINLFQHLYPDLKINKPIRLIELFAGYGSQSMALKKLQDEHLIRFEHYKVVEFDKYAIKSYNAIHNTNFEISDIRYSDLEITKQDEYQYIMTYSFPCQDLSKAGKQKGMSKGSNTRSGLLWEVERILHECSTDGCLPDILLMENVPDVIGNKNYKDFMKWYAALESFGYQSYYKILNAKDFGIPQNRDRCFMVSVRGSYNYTFPKKFELKKRLKDVLENDVDEKYYLSKKMVEYFKKHSIDCQCTTHQSGLRMDDNFIIVAGSVDLGNNESNNRVYIDDGISPTLNTMQGGNRQPKVVCNVNPSGNGINRNVYDGDISPTITTNKGEGIKIVEHSDVLDITSWGAVAVIPEATKLGFALAEEGDGVYINRPHQKRGVVQKGMIQTLKTGCNDVGVVVADGIYLNDSDRFYRKPLKDMSRTIKSEKHDSGVMITQKPRGFNKGGNFELCPPITSNSFQENNLLNKSNVCIRKLTPRECGRLMGVNDTDITKMLEVNSNSQCYKQFGNSIVVDVLYYIFKQMI